MAWALPTGGRLCSVPRYLTAASSTVALFEPGRHAACILLTGPASPDTPGLVSMVKHKMQDLILSSRVIHLAEGGPENDQAIRDRLSRLRYRSEA